MLSVCVIIIVPCDRKSLNFVLKLCFPIIATWQYCRSCAVMLCVFALSQQLCFLEPLFYVPLAYIVGLYLRALLPCLTFTLVLCQLAKLMKLNYRHIIIASRGPGPL